MPVPPEYERASTKFSELLVAARDRANLTTTNQAYTMVQGVLQAFRRRLTVAQAIAFANLLPPLVRALFVSDWDLDEPQRPFESREVMTREVQALRGDHNWAPEDSIEVVAQALRPFVHPEHFDALLAKFPPGARDFWRG
jgi:uncharacterized protein (DUF2267 family)